MEYRVLARKYRPSTFADLIGQDVLVRTLTNAFATGRIAHAFLLTGIRGVGKTTTARIIARALNCEKGPTISPCGECPQCAMIGEDRHVDVLEMDAASRTGVGDIRELIDAVRYLPGSARYKVYIIDEVHMLSASAFNALLKTLEEPPPHVKFIFATTESRKIPVTILSRCQRFDLKRVGGAMLVAHLARITARESAVAEEEALKLIAVCAEGSVRDALSLLDQAIARAGDNGKITAAAVREMIGAADNTATFTLLEALLRGNAGVTLTHLREQYEAGVDPLLMVQEALEITHLLTRVKLSPAALEDVSLSETDRNRASALAGQLSMATLARLWQMLLKGLAEVKVAPSPLSALEMLMVRIAYAAHLPTPAEALRSLSEAPPQPAAAPKEEIRSFAEAVALFQKHREALLHSQLRHDARLVSFATGAIALNVPADIPRDFTARVSECLTRWSGAPWKITLSPESGEPTLDAQEEARQKHRIEQAAAHPLVAGVLEQFPGAKVTTVKENA